MKLFRNIGIIVIVMFSFFYTEKIANYVLENNELYQEIESVKDTYEIASVSAVIDGGYIIPGLNGQVVDIKDSYYNMKDMEAFNAYYLIYDDTYPKVSLNNNIDKIISRGNSLKNSVAFVLEYDANLINYFSDNNIAASVIVTLENFAKDLELEVLNGEVNNFNDLDSLLNKYNNNSNICYVTDSNLDVCRKNNKYLVKSDKVISNSNIIDIKNNIESGDIYYVSKSTDTKNIQLIINSILYKDLEIVSLSKLISEERS